MPTLYETRRAFLDGALSKPDYIRQRYEEFHSKLFDYAEYLKEVNIAAIEITDDPVVMTSRKEGVKIACPKGDHRVAPIEMINFVDYEPDDSRMIMRLTQAARCILDVGANMGWYSINMAKAAPAAIVRAFEPLPGTYEALCGNVELNGLSNVRTYPFGLSSEKKELKFYFYPEGSGNASAANLSGREDACAIICHVEPMDEAVQRLNIGTIDFVKCDVEGAELFVFQGGRATLARDIPVVFAEMLRKWSEKFNYHPNQIIDLLRSLAYRCFTVSDDKLREFDKMDENTVETNFFFLHPERHAAELAALVS